MKLRSLVLLVSTVLVSSCGAAVTQHTGAPPSRSLYVSPSGDNSTGLTPATAFRTPQQAADVTVPGDTVFVMNGTYETQLYYEVNLQVRRSGRADAPITYKAFPGDQPKLKSRGYGAIRVEGATYINIEGFEVEGSRNEITIDEARAVICDKPVTGRNVVLAQSSGIDVIPLFDDAYVNILARSHHVSVRGNRVHGFGGGGIGSGGSDYLTFENNEVFDNALYSGYASSGMGMYQQWNSDRPTAGQEGKTYKNFIRGNVLHDNENLFGFTRTPTNPCDRASKITDGNGIIIDDFRSSQPGGTQSEPYVGRTLIENNVSYNNGGRGVNVYSSNYVDVVNNTLVRNAKTTGPTSDIDSEVSAGDATDVRFLNNIIVARPTQKASNLFSVANNQADLNSIRLDNNLVFGGTTFNAGSGSGNITGKDPLFRNDSANDFTLTEASPAIDAGASSLNGLTAPIVDARQTPRPQRNGIDLGAFEFTIAGTTPSTGGPALFKPLPEPRRLLDTRGGSLVTSARVIVDSPGDGAALNITVVGQTSPGFVTAWPCGAAQPNTSNVNFQPGPPTPNAVHVTPAPDGSVCLAASAPVHLVVDQIGSWSKVQGFVGQVPDRLLDTRNLGGKVTTATAGGLDPQRATFVNVTVVDPNEPGFVTVWPCDQPKPRSSNLNYLARETRAASALVKPSPDGRICLSAVGVAHLIVDRMGTLPAARVDTSRAGRLVDGRDVAGRTLAGVVASLASAPSARFVNVTAVDAPSAGFATVYGDASMLPKTSTVNYPANGSSSNTTIIPAGQGLAAVGSSDWRMIVDLQAEIT
jgi:hypothetical protein